MFKYLQEKTSLPTAPWSEIRSFGPTIIVFLPQNAQKLRLRLDVAMARFGPCEGNSPQETPAATGIRPKPAQFAFNIEIVQSDIVWYCCKIILQARNI